MGEPTSAKHHGLGILDSKDWDEIKHLDWDEKQSWRSSIAEWKPASPRMLHSPKASWALKRLRAVVWPKAKSTGQPEVLRKTAYLDGLRGFAAFLVYWQHHELWAHTPQENHMFENVFGFEGHHRFASFHGIRLFFNGGHFAVANFFIISGYVLSVKPLSLIQAGDQAKLADNLGSALFRRWMRLYIPLICTTFLYMLTWHAFGGLWIHGAKKQSNMRDEIWWWYAELKNFSFIFNMGGEPWFTYNFHLWSIPVEMKGSIAVYTTLLALSRATTKARLWCTAGLMFYFMYICDGWYCCFFMMGMFLADLDLLAAKGQLPRFLARLAPIKEFIYYHLLVVALYLVHGPVLWTLGDRIYSAVGWAGGNGLEQAQNIPQWVNKFPLPMVGPMGLEIAFLLPHLVLLPVTFWCAEMVTRFIDEPAVKFAQAFYKKTLGPADASAPGAETRAPPGLPPKTPKLEA